VADVPQNKVQCRECDKTVVRDRLERHMRLNHYLPHNYSRECPVCQSRVKFLSGHVQRFHKELVVRKEVHRCDRCDCWFLTTGELNLHQAEHEEFACSDCGEEFYTQLGLAKHRYTEHTAQPSVITYCIDTTGKLEVQAESEYVHQMEEEVEERDDNEEFSCTIVVDEQGNLLTEEESNSPEESVIGPDIASFQIFFPTFTSFGPAATVTASPASPPHPSLELPGPGPHLQPHPQHQTAGDGVLPRSLVGVELSPEDEELLQRAPELEDITRQDLASYQIGRPPQLPRPHSPGLKKKRFAACPSRQAHLCPYCRKIVRTRNALSRHIAVLHLQERKFGCQFCDKQFATQADVTKHFKLVHDEAGNKLVECEECGEKVRASYLKRHRNYKHNTSPLPRNCSVCQKEFKTREIMLKHVRKVHKL